MKRLITRMLSCWAAAVFCGCQSTPRADLVIWGGTIHTMDQRNPTARAVAARGGRIVFVATARGGWWGPTRGSSTLPARRWCRVSSKVTRI
jgi:hypothetical protein